MKMPARSVAWVLPLLLTACIHKADQAQQAQPLAPPIVDTPPARPAPPTDLPAPVVTAPAQAQAPDTGAQEPEPAEQPVTHRKAPAKPADPNSGSDTGVSAIGHLSSGDASDLRGQTEEAIKATERGLSDIGRKLSDQEQKTAANIREFLKEARGALATGDVEGARTLAAKARVLLEELTK
jgi:hypothetical protein